MYRKYSVVLKADTPAPRTRDIVAAKSLCNPPPAVKAKRKADTNENPQAINMLLHWAFVGQDMFSILILTPY